MVVVVVVLGHTVYVESLLLVLNSGIIPGDALGTIWMPNRELKLVLWKASALLIVLSL